MAGYKSLRDCHLQLRPINVLVGANGAGKSNLVDAFALLGALVEERLAAFIARAGGASQVLFGGPSTTEQIDLELSFGANGYRAALALSPGDQLVFLEEKCWFHDHTRYDRPYEEWVPPGALESGLPKAARERGGVYEWVFDSLDSYRVYHFHDTSRTAGVKQKGQVGDNRRLRSDASNLAAYLYRIQNTNLSLLQEIENVTRMVAPFFARFDLEPDSSTSDTIQLEWRQVGSDQYFNAHSLSDGTLRFVCLATMLLSPDTPLTIVLDEPELGLHPYALRQLAALFRVASQTRQVILATQSTALVDEFTVDDIVVVDRQEGASDLRRLDPEELSQWMNEYSLGELWEKNLFGGRPRFESA